MRSGLSHVPSANRKGGFCHERHDHHPLFRHSCGTGFYRYRHRPRHRQRGFRSIGYHFVIRLDGTIEPGRDVALDGAHCTGWNHRSIGICYIGGLDRNGRPADTRTEAQREALVRLVEDLRLVFPSLKQVIGHRDTSPDLNGDGIISPDEYIKSCPCFDVKAEFIQ